MASPLMFCMISPSLNVPNQLGRLSNQTSMAMAIDPRNGFCKSNSIFYSKRKPITLPSNPFLDVTTFISSQTHDGKVALIDAASGYQLTFSDLWKAIYSVSSSLYEMGIRRGHVVLILSPNSIFFPIVCLSVLYLGAIVTTANPLNTQQEISKQISDSNATLVFTIPQFLPKLNLASNSSVVLMSQDPVFPPCPKIVATLQEMMGKEPNPTQVKDRVTQNDIATLLYSSGTTGISKGVISTHENLIALINITKGRFRTHETDQTYIATIPMFHAYGLVSFCLCLLASGRTTIVLSKFDMYQVLLAIHKYNVTFLPLVPPILISMTNNADEIKKRYDLSSLRYVLCGGAPLSKEAMDGFSEKYSTVTILQAYALTESNGAGASMDTVEESRRFGSSGLLTASTEAKIVDPQSGEALGIGQRGELWLRGPSTMKGYFRNEEATASTLSSEGWLRTGDLCYIDDDGFIFVVDRLKELIKYKGYQVAPAELEALLLTHPDIADAAVIPYPDKEAGQIPMAYVVRKPGTNICEVAVMDFIATQVAPYKRVRRVTFINYIPKNPSGKILRKDLIKLASSKL
ncbi:hypothetical protein M9H77_18966 [Catharanthus roseus]|uniref:Uncharacterized protein n=1 Tax=Catharanthus roseus TaxID=4058 RepID=A0ACC0B982_CATRO|nr:hypothetical protein M9H77_18966 [Catharanthus roseus]